MFSPEAEGYEFNIRVKRALTIRMQRIPALCRLNKLTDVSIAGSLKKMHIRCTNCGADVPIGQTTAEVVCSYCDTQLIVGKQKGIARLVMTDCLTADEAVLRLGRFLSTLEITVSPDVLSRNVVYLPYWQPMLSAGGKVDEWVAAFAPDMESLYSVAAMHGDTSKKSVDDISAPSMMAADVVLENALMLTPYLLSELDVDRPAVLTYVPFVKLQYQVAGEMCVAYVDLVAGHVYQDNLPPTPQKQKSRVLALVAVASLVLVFLVVSLLPWQALLVAMPLLLLGEYLVMMKLLAVMGW